jgi:hypothetical protein
MECAMAWLGQQGFTDSIIEQVMSPITTGRNARDFERIY